MTAVFREMTSRLFFLAKSDLEITLATEGQERAIGGRPTFLMGRNMGKKHGVTSAILRY